MLAMYDIGLAFFVYKRPEHTQQVVQSIIENQFCNIYIFQDGLRDRKDEENWKKVQEVVRPLQNLDGAHVELHISETNKGLATSITQGITYVLGRHKAVIALEDDILLGKDYHKYASACFEKYENTPHVMSLCAAGASDAVVADKSYMQNYKYDVYFTYRLSSQAFGTWRDRWKLYRRDREFAEAFWNDEEKKYQLGELAGKDNLEYLNAVINHPEKINTWALYWTILQVISRGVTVTPIRPLSSDIGRDGSGTNSTAPSRQFVTSITDLTKRLQLPEVEDVVVDKYLMRRQNIVVENPRSIVRNIKLAFASIVRKL